MFISQFVILQNYPGICHDDYTYTVMNVTDKIGQLFASNGKCYCVFIMY